MSFLYAIGFPILGFVIYGCFNALNTYKEDYSSLKKK